MKLKVMRAILEESDAYARRLRALAGKRRLFIANLIGSPGSGKTSLLEKTLPLLRSTFRVAVVEGDVATTRDARRIAALNIPVIQVNTRGGCHLGAHQVLRAVESLDSKTQVIFIENVGNLICPTAFDVGENIKVGILSTTEGDDKPSKYPMLFREAKAIVLNKTDLIPYTDFRTEDFRTSVRMLKANLPIFELSCKTGEGVHRWADWLIETIKRGRRRPVRPGRVK